MKVNMKKAFQFVKKNYIICICVVAVLLLVFVFPALEKKGTFSLNETQYVTLDCADVVSLGGNVRCDINLNVPNKTVLAVNANYVLPEGMEYQAIVVNDQAFELYSVDEDENESTEGFAVINLDGVEGETAIGYITLKLMEDAPQAETYTIGLDNVEITTDEINPDDNSYVMYDSDDVSTTVRLANNNAALLSVTVGDTTRLFEGDTVNADFAVDATIETVNILAVLADENAEITGIALNEELSLHYGTNQYTIVVVAEDKTTTKTYTVSIYREYEFSSNVYEYSATDNTIYTKNDYTDLAILSNIDMLSEGLHYQISNGYLSVLYGYEALCAIKIINFDSYYSIVNDKLYIEPNPNLTQNSLLETFRSDTLTFKLFDTEDNEIEDADATINAGYVLKVYYEDTAIDQFTIVSEFLNFGGLIVDIDDGIIKRIPLGTTYEDILEIIATSGTITFESNDDEEITSSDVVKTGDTIAITLSDGTHRYRLSVLGDIVGNGSVGINDVGQLYRYFRNRITLEEYEIAAGDIFNDGSIAINDVGQLYRYFRNRIDSLEGDD